MLAQCIGAVTTFSSGLLKIPTPVDQVLDGRVVQMYFKIDALCEQRWQPEQHPGNTFALAVLPRTTGNSLLAARLRSSVPLSRLPRHRQARLLWCREIIDWMVEWRSVVFSDMSRFCLYVSDGRTRVRRSPGERHLQECIRSRHTILHLRLHDMGASLTNRG